MRRTNAAFAALIACAAIGIIGTRPAGALPHTHAVLRASCVTDVAISNWTTPRLAAQVVVMPVDESELPSASVLVAQGLGGLVLFGSKAPTNFVAQIAMLDRAAVGGITPFVMADEEGGAIQRLQSLIGPLISPRQMASTLSPKSISALAQVLGHKMASIGVDVDLSPVLDLDAGPGPDLSHPDGTRSFSAVVSVASQDGVAFERGLQSGGVLGVVKHFPGLGGGSGNPDYGASATRSWATLQMSGLLPFKAAIAAGAPAVMIADASVPGLTALPAAVSSQVITTVLKGELGFNGLVITDSLSAVSVQRAGLTVPTAVVRALAAGADIVLFNAIDSERVTTTRTVIAAIVASVDHQSLSRARLIDAVRHVLAAKHDICT